MAEITQVVVGGTTYDIKDAVAGTKIVTADGKTSLQAVTNLTPSYPGNTRGNGAVDLQMNRATNSQIASGSYSTAMGYNNTVYGLYSTAMGGNNIVSDSYSTAMGYNNTAYGLYSTAMGGNNIVSGYSSTAMGYNNTASGYSSIAMGYNNTASGYYSTAMGYNNTASGSSSTAMGYNNTASGYSSIAMGSNVLLNQNAVLAIGDNLSPQGAYSGMLSRDCYYYTQTTLLEVPSGSLVVGTMNVLDKSAAEGDTIAFQINAAGQLTFKTTPSAIINQCNLIVSNGELIATCNHPSIIGIFFTAAQGNSSYYGYYY